MKKNNKNLGFSLLELLIAMVILSLIMVAIASIMGTTTRTYTNTKEDIAIQQEGQQLYDMIADHIMQASSMRIGYVDPTSGQVYEAAKCGTINTVKVSSTGQLMTQADTPAINSFTGNALYDFSTFGEKKPTGMESREIKYMAFFYEQKSTEGYEPVVVTYYFDDNKVYMNKLFAGGFRVNSIQEEPTPEGCVAVNVNGSVQMLNIDGFINLALFYGNTSDDKIISKNVEAISGYALPSENAIYLNMHLEDRHAENDVQGMVTIRNNYVLKPRNNPGN